VMLPYSLLVLLHGAQTDAAARQSPASHAGTAVAFTRWTLILGVAPGTLVILGGGLADQSAARHGKNSGVHPMDYGLIALVIVVVAFAVYRSRKTRDLTADSTPPSPTLLSASAAAIALLCAATTTTFGVYASPDTVGPTAIRVVEMLVLTAFDLAIIQSATKYRQTTHKPRPTAELPPAALAS
jgi:hypothetical protein